jgi:hypothetical protein
MLEAKGRLTIGERVHAGKEPCKIMRGNSDHLREMGGPLTEHGANATPLHRAKETGLTQHR